MTSGEHESSRLPRIDFCQVGQKVPLWGIIDEYHCLGVVMNRRLMALALLFILSLTCSALAGVPYTLEGILTVHSDAITLNTADGRVFSLEMDTGKAKSLDGQHVRVEGDAFSADEVSRLTVKRIDKTEPQAPEVVLPPFKANQRPAHLVADKGDTVVMSDVRWNFKPGPNGKDPDYIWDTVSVRPDLVDKVYFVKKPFSPRVASRTLLHVVHLQAGRSGQLQGPAGTLGHLKK